MEVVMMKMSDTQVDVLRYIGLLLAYKNCENDLKEFEKITFKSGQFLTWLVEAGKEQIEEDMKLYRSINVKVEKSDNARVYYWRKGGESGSIRLSRDQLLKLTTDTLMKYFSEYQLDIKPKGWY
jgi:hypothetical protein